MIPIFSNLTIYLLFIWLFPFINISKIFDLFPHFTVFIFYILMHLFYWIMLLLLFVFLWYCFPLLVGMLITTILFFSCLPWTPYIHTLLDKSKANILIPYLNNTKSLRHCFWSSTLSMVLLSNFVLFIFLTTLDIFVHIFFLVLPIYFVVFSLLRHSSEIIFFFKDILLNSFSKSLIGDKLSFCLSENVYPCSCKIVKHKLEADSKPLWNVEGGKYS